MLQQSSLLDAPVEELVDYLTDEDQRRSSLIAGTLFVSAIFAIAAVELALVLARRSTRDHPEGA